MRAFVTKRCVPTARLQCREDAIQAGFVILHAFEIRCSKLGESSKGFDFNASTEAAMRERVFFRNDTLNFHHHFLLGFIAMPWA